MPLSSVRYPRSKPPGSTAVGSNRNRMARRSPSRHGTRGTPPRQERGKGDRQCADQRQWATPRRGRGRRDPAGRWLLGAYPGCGAAYCIGCIGAPGWETGCGGVETDGGGGGAWAGRPVRLGGAAPGAGADDSAGGPAGDGRPDDPGAPRSSSSLVPHARQKTSPARRGEPHLEQNAVAIVPLAPTRRPYPRALALRKGARRAAARTARQVRTASTSLGWRRTARSRSA
jgi:hypothetical protein